MGWTQRRWRRVSSSGSRCSGRRRASCRSAWAAGGTPATPAPTASDHRRAGQHPPSEAAGNRFLITASPCTPVQPTLLWEQRCATSHEHSSKTRVCTPVAGKLLGAAVPRASTLYCSACMYSRLDVSMALLILVLRRHERHDMRWSLWAGMIDVQKAEY